MPLFTNLKEKIILIHQFQFKNWNNKSSIFLLHSFEKQAQIFGCHRWDSTNMITMVSSKFLAMYITKLYFVPLPQWVQQDRSSRSWVVLPRSPHRKYLWIVLANLLGAIFLHQPIFLCKNTKLQFVNDSIVFPPVRINNTNYVLQAKENLCHGSVSFDQNFFRFSKLTLNFVFLKFFTLTAVLDE